jgi:hypothetical protein
MELTNQEIDLALYGLTQSVGYLKDYFPGSHMAVVYIPSPPACYEWGAPEISIHSYHDRRTRYPAEHIRPKSLLIREKVKALCVSAGIDFLDSTPVLQQAALKELIHGPRDWMHLNCRGYETLGEFISDYFAGKA